MNICYVSSIAALVRSSETLVTRSGDDSGHLLVSDASLSLVFMTFVIVSNNLFLMF